MTAEDTESIIEVESPLPTDGENSNTEDPLPAGPTPSTLEGLLQPKQWPEGSSWITLPLNMYLGQGNPAFANLCIQIGRLAVVFGGTASHNSVTGFYWSEIVLFLCSMFYVLCLQQPVCLFFLLLQDD